MSLQPTVRSAASRQLQTAGMQHSISLMSAALLAAFAKTQQCYFNECAVQSQAIERQ
jgi:hypothetical protein